MSRLVLLAELAALLQRIRNRRKLMAFATLALGMGIFALFFGLVAACDRL
jgi:hypothetical protein